MKSILFITFLAFAAQASLLDTESYTDGFNHQLGLSSGPTADGLSCFSSLNATLANAAQIVELLQSNSDYAVYSVLSLISTVDGPLKEDCEQYASDILSYVANASHVTSEEALEDTVKSNAQRYAPQLIQQVTEWIDAITTGDEYQAGSTEAYIVQVLVGAEVPSAIEEPTINYNYEVPLNYTAFILEFYNTLYSSLGLDGAEISEEYLQCYNNLTVAAPLIENIVKSVQQAGGLDEIDVIRTSVDDLSFAIEACLPVAQAALEVYAPVYEAIEQDPVSSILTILHNVGINLPGIEQSGLNVDVYDLYGNYGQAGEIVGGEILTIFRNAGY